MIRARRFDPLSAPWLIGLICAAALAATGVTLAERLPVGAWGRLIAAPDLTDMRQVVVLYSVLPRVAVSLMAGAGLALAGTLLQQVLRNPLAAPSTLGIAAGANLALALATLLAPGLLMFGRDVVALAGAALAAAAVLGLSWRRGFSPVTVVLAGLVIGLYCGAVSALLVLLNERYLAGLFLWGSGALSQQDWSATMALLPRLAVAAVIAGLLARPLAMLDLGEEGARSLGLPLGLVRVAGLGLAVAITAVIVSAVGVIGFVGLIAPTLARLAGARTFRARLIAGPAIGAALLWFTDQMVQTLAGAGGELLPTGAVTALIGAPLLLWLLPRLRLEPPRPRPLAATPRRLPAAAVLGVLAVLAVIAVVVSLSAGRTPAGGWTWAFDGRGDWMAVMPWRAPRVAAAVAAGALLAVAGTALQRLSGNPMASPEVLGISAGAAFGLMIGLFTITGLDRGGQTAAAAIGAFLALVVVLAFNRRSGFSPERVMIAGLAIGALLDAVVGVLMASGDPRAMQMLTWLTGSTYGVDASIALWTIGLALGLLAVAPLTARWLDLLPLGAPVALAVGLKVGRARGAILLLTAGLTAVATLVVGPLSFVGLMAPHLAARLGLRRAGTQMAGAGLAGAGLMAAADGLGRLIDFPWQMPAGLIAAVIGAPVLMLLLQGRR